MRLTRSLAVAAAAALAAAGIGAPPSTAQTPSGVGTAAASTRLFEVLVGADGAVLRTGLVADEARASIDPAVGTPEALARLLRLQLDTPVAELDALAAGLPAVEARTPGGSPEVALPGATVQLPPATAPAAGALATVTVDPTKLNAGLAGGAATAGIAAGVRDLSLAAGLVAAGQAGVAVTTSANGTQADSTRSATVADVTVLDLSALLTGMGIDLASLPVGTVADLIDVLGLLAAVESASGITVDGTLAGAIDALYAAAAAVDDLTAPTTEQIVTTIDTTLTGTGLDGLISVDDAPTATDAVAVIDTTLDDLLAAAVSVLDGAALLSLQGVEVGVVSRAVSTVEPSAATVTGRIGAVKVGDVDVIPGTDLLAAAAAVPQAVEAAEAQLNAVLGAIDPSLAGIVDLTLLDLATSGPTKAGEYVKAAAGITAASATVTPPTTLAAIIEALADVSNEVLSVGEELGASLPVVSTAMEELRTAMALSTDVLSSPTTVRVAQVLSAAEFRPGTTAVVVPPGGPELPRTGGGAGPLVAAAGLAVVVAAGMRRWLRQPAVQPARVED